MLPGLIVCPHEGGVTMSIPEEVSYVASYPPANDQLLEGTAIFIDQADVAVEPLFLIVTRD